MCSEARPPRRQEDVEVAPESEKPSDCASDAEVIMQALLLVMPRGGSKSQASLATSPSAKVS